MKPLLQVRNLNKRYHRSLGLWRRCQVDALHDVSFTLYEQQTLAIVGMAGSGKSTLGRILVGAEAADSGEILLNNQLLDPMNSTDCCRSIRMVFQHPESSLNPRRPIGRILEETLRLNTHYQPEERRLKVERALRLVGLLPDHAAFYPHMLSTGQRARVAIARALILNPQIIIADEPLSSLDLSIRAQIVNLLLQLQKNLGLSYIMISNRLKIVRHMSDQILVLENGRVMEKGETESLLCEPKTECTRKLIHGLAPSREQA